MEAAQGSGVCVCAESYSPLLGTTWEAVLTELVLRFNPTFTPVFVSLIKLPLEFGTDDIIAYGSLWIKFYKG